MRFLSVAWSHARVTALFLEPWTQVFVQHLFNRHSVSSFSQSTLTLTVNHALFQTSLNLTMNPAVLNMTATNREAGSSKHYILLPLTMNPVLLNILSLPMLNRAFLTTRLPLTDNKIIINLPPKVNQAPPSIFLPGPLTRDTSLIVDPDLYIHLPLISNPVLLNIISTLTVNPVLPITNLPQWIQLFSI